MHNFSIKQTIRRCVQREKHSSYLSNYRLKYIIPSRRCVWREKNVPVIYPTTDSKSSPQEDVFREKNVLLAHNAES